VRALKHDNLIIASVCLSRMRYGGDMSAGPLTVNVALLECRAWQSNSDQGGYFCDMDVLSAEFFDDESMVLLYKYQKKHGALISYLQSIALIVIGGPGQTIIAMFDYNDLGYQTLSLDGYINGPSREELVQHVLQLWNEGHVCIVYWHIVETFQHPHAGRLAPFRSLLVIFPSNHVGN